MSTDEDGCVEPYIANNEENRSCEMSIMNEEDTVCSKHIDSKEEKNSEYDNITVIDEGEVGSIVCKIFERIWWHNGIVAKTTKSTVSDVEHDIRFSKREVKTWNKEIFNMYHLKAIISIDDKGWRFVEKI